MNEKYPNTWRQGFLLETPHGLKLNEDRFFMSLDYNSLRLFEDGSSYTSKWNVSNERKLDDVEKFLSRKFSRTEE